MNKVLFRVLVVLMSLSLIGIIFVQVYWFNSSLENNQEQFKFHVKQVLGNVSEDIKNQEILAFVDKINQFKDSTGADEVNNTDFLEFGYYERNSQTNETIIYSNSINSQDFTISPTFFDKKSDSLKVKSFSSKRKTEVYLNGIDKNNTQNALNPDVKIEKSGDLKILDNDEIKKLISQPIINSAGKRSGKMYWLGEQY